MSEMTQTALKDAVAAYADPSKSHATTYTPSTNSVSGMLNRIGAVVQIVTGAFVNRWLKFYKSKLEEGQDIELWFKPLVTPTAYTGEADQTAEASNIKPMYAYPLGEQRYKQTIDEIEMNRAVQSPQALGQLVAATRVVLDKSVSAFEDGSVTQILSEWRDIAEGDGGPKASQIVTLADAINGATATAYIKGIKSYVRKLREASSDYNKTGVLTSSGALNLAIRGDILDSISVDALAGAINSEELDLKVNIIEVETFRKADKTASDISAMLFDDNALAVFPVVDHYNEADIPGTHKRNIFRYRDVTVCIAYAANVVYFKD